MHKMRMCLSLCFKGWSSSLLDVLNALHEIFICSLGVYLAKRSIVVLWFLNPDNHIFINLLNLLAWYFEVL